MNNITHTEGYLPHAATRRRATRVNTCLCLLLTGMLAACWAPVIKPSAGELAGLRTLLIVPVEAPPLEATPDLLERRVPAYRHYQNMALDFPMRSTVYQTPGGITVAGHIGMNETNGGEVLATTTSADKEPFWTPAKAAALRARRLLAEENYDPVLSQTSYRLPLPGDERGANLQDWYKALRTWYGLDETPVDYQANGAFDAVLELGIGGYRLFENQVSLQLVLKLIDPVSRRVIARTRHEDFVVKDSAAFSVIRDGELFKQLIADLSVPLLKQGLVDLGLNSRRRGDYD